MLRSRVAFDRRGAWTAGDSHEDIEDVDVFTPHLSSLALRLGTTVILILTQLAVNTKPRILGSSMPTYPRGNLERPGVRATYLLQAWSREGTQENFHPPLLSSVGRAGDCSVHGYL